MLWNSFIEFAVEHQLSCHATDLTKSYTVALKCAFLSIFSIDTLANKSSSISYTTSSSLALLSPLAHTQGCWIFLITGRSCRALLCVTDDEVCGLVLLQVIWLKPIPTSSVKDCIDILVTPITSIVNFSLSEGSFPPHFKSALAPLMKRAHPRQV